MQNDEAPNDPPAPELSQSRGINAEAGRDLNVGRDLTGRDRIEIHAESGSTVILNQQPASTSGPLASPSVALSTSKQQSKIINHQSPANPFFAGGYIPDPHLFFGR